MVPFKTYIIESVNTLISDVNEILTGYYINGKKWYDKDAQTQLQARKSQIDPVDYARADGHAQIMASEFINWATKKGYKGIEQVFWTARPGSLAAATGISDIDSKKNPSDILVKFTTGPNKFLGLSAKSTKGKTDIGFKNPGIGTIDNYLNAGLATYYTSALNSAIKKFKLPVNTSERKSFIRSNPKLKAQTELYGANVLSKLRDMLLNACNKLTDDARRQFITNVWMDAGQIFPPYIKVTGFGNKPPYTAKVTDPLDNEKLDALSKPIKFEKIGNDSVGVKAGNIRIMKMRIKFESEKLASSVKLSGDPW